MGKNISTFLNSILWSMSLQCLHPSIYNFTSIIIFTNILLKQLLQTDSPPITWRHTSHLSLLLYGCCLHSTFRYWNFIWAFQYSSIKIKSIAQNVSCILLAQLIKVLLFDLLKTTLKCSYDYRSRNIKLWNLSNFQDRQSKTENFSVSISNSQLSLQTSYYFL